MAVVGEIRPEMQDEDEATWFLKDLGLYVRYHLHTERLSAWVGSETSPMLAAHGDPFEQTHTLVRHLAFEDERPSLTATFSVRLH